MFCLQATNNRPPSEEGRFKKKKKKKKKKTEKKEKDKKEEKKKRKKRKSNPNSKTKLVKAGRGREGAHLVGLLVPACVCCLFFGIFMSEKRGKWEKK